MLPKERRSPSRRVLSQKPIASHAGPGNCLVSLIFLPVAADPRDAVLARSDKDGSRPDV